jgi:hypothetical protein
LLLQPQSRNGGLKNGLAGESRNGCFLAYERIDRSTRKKWAWLCKRGAAVATYLNAGN